MRKVTAVFAALIASIFLLTACGGGTHNDAKAPTSLTGSWHQINKLPNHVNMAATIYGDSIQINMVTRDGSEIYWLGSFDSNRSPSAPFTTVSRGDQDGMAMSIFASQDPTKTFTYKRGVLSYKFSMLGDTNVVKLAKVRQTNTPAPSSTATVYAYGTKTPSTKASSPKASPKKTAKPTETSSNKN